MRRPISFVTESETDAAYWTLQLAGWGLYFGLQTYEETVLIPTSWSKALTIWSGICLSSIVFTHLLRHVAKRQGWLTLPPAALLKRALIGAVLVTSASLLVIHALSWAVYGSIVEPSVAALASGSSVRLQLLIQYTGFFALYLGWTALYFSLTAQRYRYRVELRQAQLSESLRASELRLLKSQLNPHFLFNALNGVRALIAEEPSRAQEAVTRLARLLRYTLALNDEDMVTLARELELIDDYLALESLRLAERLQIVRDIDPAAPTVRVPIMLLQTLVENAIKHGIAQLKQGGTLRIAAHIVGADLVITVENPRPSSPPPTDAGVGLKNSFERLRLLFGSAAKLSVDLSQPDRAIAEVRLPL